jgi:CheY-like chemotaxis protein
VHPFDVILCDVGMPQRNGLDVCTMLRASGYRGKLILMTGWDSYVVNSDRRAAQVDQMLKKPFVGQELRQLLDSLVS